MHFFAVGANFLKSNWFWGVLALGGWLGSYFIYLRKDFEKFRQRRTPQRWGVDLNTRQITSGRKPLV